jgi:hypothetical protein
LHSDLMVWFDVWVVVSAFGVARILGDRSTGIRSTFLMYLASFVARGNIGPRRGADCVPMAHNPSPTLTSRSFRLQNALAMAVFQYPATNGFPPCLSAIRLWLTN